jgi:hypothetical protein
MRIDAIKHCEARPCGAAIHSITLTAAQRADVLNTL